MKLFESYMSKFNFGTLYSNYQNFFIEIGWMLYIDCRENYARLHVEARE